MGLFGISRILHFRVCSDGEPRASPHTAQQGELFYREKKEVGRARVNKGFSLPDLLPGVKRSLPSHRGALLLSQGVRAPPSGPLTV